MFNLYLGTGFDKKLKKYSSMTLMRFALKTSQACRSSSFVSFFDKVQ